MQTPNTLKRQQAVSIFNESDGEEEVDHNTRVTPGEKVSEKMKSRMCPYCPKVLLLITYPVLYL